MVSQKSLQLIPLQINHREHLKIKKAKKETIGTKRNSRKSVTKDETGTDISPSPAIHCKIR